MVVGQDTHLNPSVSNTVKSHVKALGLYNFIKGFVWVYKREGGGGGGGAYIRVSL